MKKDSKSKSKDNKHTRPSVSAGKDKPQQPSAISPPKHATTPSADKSTPLSEAFRPSAVVEKLMRLSDPKSTALAHKTDIRGSQDGVAHERAAHVRSLSKDKGTAPPERRKFALNLNTREARTIQTTQLLESIVDPEPVKTSAAFNIFDIQNKNRVRESGVKETAAGKAYKFHDLNIAEELAVQNLNIDNKQAKPSLDAGVHQSLVGMTKPSEIYNLPKAEKATRISVFQTPPLPIFTQSKITTATSAPTKPTDDKQEALRNFFKTSYDSCGTMITEDFSKLDTSKEKGVTSNGHGVWKIGKIKIRRGEIAELNINGIKFQGRLGYGEGSAVCMKDNNSSMHELGVWSGMWVMQPSSEIFDTQ